MAYASALPTTALTNGAPQEAFVSRFEMDDPVRAITSYSKILHEHTKKQLEQSERRKNRRSDQSGISVLAHISSDGSVDSVDNFEQS